MNKQIFIAAVLILTGAVGCKKDYNLNDRGSEPKYVIEGRISNLRGPYYVRVTRSENVTDISDSANQTWADLAPPVTNAQVMISDDMDQTDTLKLADYRHDTWYNYRMTNGVMDSFFSAREATYDAERGYYCTTKMTAIPGHTYTLRVNIGDQTFTASAAVPFPVSLDSVTVLTPNSGDPNINPAQIAYASWKEPQDQTNYYCLQGAYISNYPYDAALGAYSQSLFYRYYVFDDRTLPAYVSRMEVDEYITNNSNYDRVAPYPVNFDGVDIRLCNIDRITYEYMNALGKQFLNDGSAYQPTPASAKGNISGGALGLFFGMGISRKMFLQ